MIRFIVLLCVLTSIPAPGFAGPAAFPAGIHTLEVESNGATYHVRVGGSGPAVLMLHGFGDSGDMWAPLAAEMIRDHTIIVPDLRGMGLSSHPETGYDKKSQGVDIANILDHLKIARVDLVTHDIGNMVGFAFAAQYPDRVTRYVIMDAPLPGIGPWNSLLSSPALWHFNFRGPDVERLVAGRERIYLDRFYNEFSANPGAVDEATRQHYAMLYAKPHAMHDAFEQFGAFAQDAIDNKALLTRGKLRMPVLAIGGSHSFGPGMADAVRDAATNVESVVIADSGHWLMEEQPIATIAAIRHFLDTAEAENRLTTDDITGLASSGAGAGTSLVKAPSIAKDADFIVPDRLLLR